MGRLGTLEGFTLKGMLDRLSIPAGFVIDLRCWDNTILLTIEDHRGHADFEGDRSADRLPELLERLSILGLDACKAIVSLGSREEPLRTGRPESFDVGVVQLGWAVSVPTAPKRPIPDDVSSGNNPQPRQLRMRRSVSFS